jgi:hypothetical protein
MPWMLLSNHGHVLLYVDMYPDACLHEIATAIGITKRSPHKIVSDLEAGGYISREWLRRRNHYVVHRQAPLRHARVVGRTLGDLLGALEPDGYAGRANALDASGRASTAEA